MSTTPIDQDAPTVASFEPTVASFEPTMLIDSVDGYSLTVGVDRTTVAPSEDVTFTATFTNDTDTAIDYQPVACGAAGVVMLLQMPFEPLGDAWDGVAGEFKDYVLTAGAQPGIVPSTDPMRRELGRPRCEGGRVDASLRPGKAVTSRFVWPTDFVDGVPVLPGEIPFEAVVSYDLQDEPPSSDPTGVGISASSIAVYKSLAVKGTIEVIGERPTIVSAGQAIDGLLRDASFRTWLDEMPPSTWTNANLFLQHWPEPNAVNPEGASWAIELFREIDVPRNWAIAAVDPFDGHLIQVRYCNDPCDR